MSPRAVIREQIESGPERRELVAPVPSFYRLGDLLPRRAAGQSYRTPGEMGERLAGAFERVFSWMESAHGTLAIQAPSKLLTPRWHRLLNYLRKEGFAATITLSLPHRQGLPLWYFDIASPFRDHLTDGSRPQVSRFSRGFSQDYDHALAKVVGECLERVPLLQYRNARLVRSSPRALRSRGLPFIEPGKLSVFAPWQKERRPELQFNDDSVFQWTWCRSAISDRKALIPAQLVFWNYSTWYSDVPEPILRECSTHGAGGFFSTEGALVSGLSEYVQRDAFFVQWLRKRTPPRIDSSTLRDQNTRELVEQARQVGLEPILLDMTSDLGIPTCVCALVREDSSSPCLSMGASCRLSGDRAIHDALLEAGSVHHLLALKQQLFTLPQGYAPFCDASVRTDERLAFWADPRNAEHIEFFLKGPMISADAFSRGIDVPETAEEQLDCFLRVFRSRGWDAWYYEASHPVLDRLGYASVKVIVPDLVPLYYDEINAPLGHPRLRQPGRNSEPFNPWPHPFP